MDNEEHTRQAAEIIAAILAHTLDKAEQEGRQMYVWEREAVEWLRKQWDLDPGTMINMWTADRYVSNKKLDLYGKLSPRSVAS